MKYFLIFNILFVLHSYSIIGQNSQKITSMISYFNDRNYSSFMTEFPETYVDFLSLYGFDLDKGKAAPFYYDSYKHINFIFSDSLLNDTRYFEKIFNIATSAKWDADAINYLQDNLITFIMDNPQYVYNFIKKYSEKDIKNFFIFILDNPHPYQKSHQNMCDKLKGLFRGIDKNIVDFIEQSYESVKKDWPSSY